MNGESVSGRLLTCNDLAAEEAIYHSRCMTNFKFSASAIEKKGRPVNAAMMNAFDETCLWLENEADAEIFTLNKLYKKMQCLRNASETYSVKAFKLKLQERYGDHIYFSEFPGREHVFGFKNMTFNSNRIQEKRSRCKRYYYHCC